MRTLVKTAACAALLACGTANAGIYMLIDTTYSGDPAAATPSITTTFTQTGPDAVRLTIESNLSNGEFVSRLFFNMEPFSPVTATFNSGLSSGMFGDPQIFMGEDQFMAASGGLFDFLLQFPVVPPDKRFNMNDVAVIDLAAPGLTFGHFAAASAPGGPGLSFFTAAHIQGIGPQATGSGWAGSVEVIPLPASSVLGMAGLALAICVRYSRLA